MDTIQSINGCDSVINITLITEYYNDTINDTICSGQTYILPDNNTASISGTYSFSEQSINSCDSLYTIILFVEDTLRSLENIIICGGENYVLPSGVLETEQGVYFSNLQTLVGCDSIVKTNLVVLELDTLYIDTVMSDVYNTYTLPDGSVISDIGEYETILETINGCDSLIITNVRAVSEWGIPNIFSPNANQDANKVFTIINQHGLVELMEMQIYNRWGERVFDMKEAGVDYWNGYYKGVLQSVGNYTYLIKVKDSKGKESEYHSGNFLLVW